ncbi:MAG: DUF3237 domain-containing protein [Rhodocyclaceae bacterium]|nr:DUF3237 domain-containing protein [Rhodocyclaceae bacterium]
MSIKQLLRIPAAALLILGLAQVACAQSTQVTTEYLMTYKGELAAPDKINDAFMVVNVRGPGWIKGPKIRGRFIAPGGDWLRIMPSGALRLDVRATIRTDDGALIFFSYNGILQLDPATLERLMKGETLRGKDIPYFITAPTFETSAPQYAWLNGVQAVNKVVELKFGEDGYVIYDTFILR